MKSFPILAGFVLLFSQMMCEVVSADTEHPGLYLYEVKPSGDEEGFALINLSDSPINLKDYRVEDSSGASVEFKSDLQLEQGKSLIIVRFEQHEQEQDLYFLNRDGHPHSHWGDNGIEGSLNFRLSDSNDALFLIRNSDDQIIDSFYYGDIAIKQDDSCWSGRPFTTIKSQANAFVVRNTEMKEAKAASWYLWGTTSYVFDPNKKIDAEISPFLFPECGGIPVYRALEAAKSSIVISMYEITSPGILGCLMDRINHGVTVNILIEGRLAQVYLDGSSDYAGRLKYLSDAGADIKIMTKSDIYDSNVPDLHRYISMHTKYCVIDRETSIISSENYDTYSFDGKVIDNPEDGETRGWGAIIKSTEYADFLLNIFANDIDKTYGDIFDFDEIYPNIRTVELSYVSPTDEYPLKTFNQPITPMMGPDSQWDGTLHYIDNSSKRVYVEMLSAADSYFDMHEKTKELLNESPILHMKTKADSGLDVKFLLCIGKDQQQKILDYVDDINENTKIKMGYMATPYLHNKGLICDDVAIVSSINWSVQGLFNNREVSVAIHSKEIADFFAESFLGDFEKNYRVDGLDLTIEGVQKTVYGTTGLYATVNVLQTGRYTCTWKLDGVDIQSSRMGVEFDITLGTHVLSVTVTDLYNLTSETSITFEVVPYKIEQHIFIEMQTVSIIIIQIPQIAYFIGMHRRGAIP